MISHKFRFPYLFHGKCKVKAFVPTIVKRRIHISGFLPWINRKFYLRRILNIFIELYLISHGMCFQVCGKQFGNRTGNSVWSCTGRIILTVSIRPECLDFMILFIADKGKSQLLICVIIRILGFLNRNSIFFRQIQRVIVQLVLFVIFRKGIGFADFIYPDFSARDGIYLRIPCPVSEIERKAGGLAFSRNLA